MLPCMCCSVSLQYFAAYIFIREISPVTSADGQYTFTSSKQEGAILVPGGNIDTADAVERSKYTRYIRENSASWLEFANERHHRDLRLIDLVLVTGWHKTASWGCAAFSQCSREINLTFNVGAGTTQGGVWGKWSDIVSPGVWGHSGPPREDGQPRPQSDKSPTNVDNLEKMKSCVSTFHRLLAYGCKLIFNARPAQSEQMKGAYQNISADVQALGQQQTLQSIYDPVTNQWNNRNRLYKYPRSRDIHTWL